MRVRTQSELKLNVNLLFVAGMKPPFSAFAGQGEHRVWKKGAGGG